MSSIVRVLALQTNVVREKEENLSHVSELIRERVSSEKPDVIVLPEMFNCPYNTAAFPVYAEETGGESWQMLSDIAKETGCYIVGGSIPERGENDRIYNTCYVFDRSGEQIAKHRKVFLFDIRIKNGQHFRESDTLSPGCESTVFETEFGTMGVSICFDIRFPEIFRELVYKGARIVFLPASFNMTTGPAHWDLTIRSRAVDNQLFFLGCATARCPELGYVSYGNSMLSDPWGNVIAHLDEKEDFFLAEIDLDQADAIREQLPILESLEKKRQEGRIWKF